MRGELVRFPEFDRHSRAPQAFGHVLHRRRPAFQLHVRFIQRLFAEVARPKTPHLGFAGLPKVETGIHRFARQLGCLQLFRAHVLHAVGPLKLVT